jgi:predicted CoA-binding protein
MDDHTLRSIFETVKTIAVVGLSDRPDRASHEVAGFLSARGYKIIGVNPVLAGKTLFGQPIVADLAQIDEPVHMVDVFRRAGETPAIARAATAIGAKVLWLQLGIINTDAAKIANDAGMAFVMDKCPKIEWPRLYPGR